MAQEVFERIEKKYLITINQYNELISLLITRMNPDQYGKHTIHNIYFDTPDYQMIRKSLEKPLYKEKIRLRSYGTPSEGDTVFIELKKKYNGVVYKRRIPMSLRNARKYMYYGIRTGEDSQILKEIDYAMHFYQAKPMAYVAYERIAFSEKEHPELRMTFDMNIRARSSELELEKDDYGYPLLQPGQMLMEIKIPGAMPVWMSRVLAEIGIFPVTYSKYGTYYRNYIEKRTDIHEGGRICA